jgi:excisionase family DNA binding protein
MKDEQRPPPPYKVKEYAARARVTPNAVYDMVRRGELLAVRFGRAIRIPREAGDKKLTGEAT